MSDEKIVKLSPGIGPLNKSNFSESSNCVTSFGQLLNILGKTLRGMVSISVLDKDLKVKTLKLTFYKSLRDLNLLKSTFNSIIIGV